MAVPLSAADILNSTEFFEASDKAKRYISYKFQDYGYRLAEKLGDLQNRQIYMRLAKHEDRSLLDMALQFSLDYYDQPNKGKLFMWKLKQLRAERSLYQAKSNFEHDFVMQTMSNTLDQLAHNIYSKHKARMDEVREAMLHKFAEFVQHSNRSKRKITKMLNLGIACGVDAHVLARHPVKVYGFDVSRQQVNLAKQHCQGQKINVVRKKTFLENSYQEAQFNGVWMDKFWQIIPHQSEHQYLVELYRLLAEGGYLGITIRPAAEPQQSWQEISWKNQTLLTLFKSNSLLDLQETTRKLGFKTISQTGNTQITLTLQKI